MKPSCARQECTASATRTSSAWRRQIWRCSPRNWRRLVQAAIPLNSTNFDGEQAACKKPQMAPAPSVCAGSCAAIPSLILCCSMVAAEHRTRVVIAGGLHRTATAHNPLILRMLYPLMCIAGGEQRRGVVLFCLTAVVPKIIGSFDHLGFALLPPTRCASPWSDALQASDGLQAATTPNPAMPLRWIKLLRTTCDGAAGSAFSTWQSHRQQCSASGRRPDRCRRGRHHVEQQLLPAADLHPRRRKRLRATLANCAHTDIPLIASGGKPGE